MTKISIPLFEGSNITEEVETSLTVATDENIKEFEDNPNFGIFRILDPKKGDERLVWNRMNTGDIREAESRFKEFMSKGLTPFRVDPGGGKGDRMTSFDPLAEEVLFLPEKMVVGG